MRSRLVLGDGVAKWRVLAYIAESQRNITPPVAVLLDHLHLNRAASAGSGCAGESDTGDGFDDGRLAAGLVADDCDAWDVNVEGCTVDVVCGGQSMSYNATRVGIRTNPGARRRDASCTNAALHFANVVW